MRGQHVLKCFPHFICSQNRLYHIKQSIMRLLVIAGDLIVFNLLYLLVCRCSGSQFPVDAVVRSHIVLSAFYFCFAINSGVVLHYRKVHYFQIFLKVLRNMLLLAVIGTPLLVWGQFALPDWSTYALFLLCATVGVSLYRMTLRSLIKRYRMSVKRVSHVVLVGNSENLIELYNEMSVDPTLGYKVVGYFDDGGKNLYPDTAVRLGAPGDVIPYLSAHSEVHECYCSLPSARAEEILPIIHHCENNLVHFYSVPNVRNYLRHRMHFNILGNVPYLSLHEEPLASIGNRALKRTFDILFSLIFLCTLFPIVFIVVFIVTKSTMPGPVFFRQKRNGLNGREFYCLKFRSMKVNADADRVQATKDDPRKTKWGNIMRKTNIDELPQFINVLMGDMSIVGPRPHMVKHTEEYSRIIDKYMVRHWVKPGITGWSQVMGFRGETKELSQMEDRISGDIWYIEHWAFWLDLFIIYKTVANAVHGEDNAY